MQEESGDFAGPKESCLVGHSLYSLQVGTINCSPDPLEVNREKPRLARLTVLGTNKIHGIFTFGSEHHHL